MNKAQIQKLLEDKEFSRDLQLHALGYNIEDTSKAKLTSLSQALSPTNKELSPEDLRELGSTKINSGTNLRELTAALRRNNVPSSKLELSIRTIDGSTIDMALKPENTVEDGLLNLARKEGKEFRLIIASKKINPQDTIEQHRDTIDGDRESMLLVKMEPKETKLKDKVKNSTMRKRGGSSIF